MYPQAAKRERSYQTAMDGYTDAMLRLVPPVFSTQDYQDGYRTGFRERLYNAKLAIEALRENYEP